MTTHLRKTPRVCPSHVDVEETVSRFGYDPGTLKDSSSRLVVTHCPTCGVEKLKNVWDAFHKPYCYRFLCENERFPVPPWVSIAESWRMFNTEPRMARPGSSTIVAAICYSCGEYRGREMRAAHEYHDCLRCRNKSQTHSEKRRANHSLSMKKWYETNVNPSKGKTYSEEIRKRMSVSAKARTDRPKRKLLRPKEWRPHKGRGLRFLYDGPEGKFYVRSSWERALIDYLNKNKIPFQYEPKKFAVEYLSEGVLKTGKYTPDFFLPSLGKWWEIKGRWTQDAKSKLESFRVRYPEERIEVLHEIDLLRLGINVRWNPEEISLMRAGVWPFPKDSTG